MKENQFLATEVMGWALFESFPGEWSYTNDPRQIHITIEQKYWNPRENIAQAMGLLDQFELWELKHNTDDTGLYYCEICTDIGSDVFYGDTSITGAIVNAVLKAKGFKDD